MKKLLSIGFFLVSASLLFAQNQSDSIEVKKGLGTSISLHGNKLSLRQLLDTTKINTEAFKEMEIAKKKMDIVTVLEVVGVLGVGYGIAPFGGTPNPTVALTGLGLIFVAIPFHVACAKHAKKAVRIYNNGLKQVGMHKIDMKIGFTCSRIGLKMTF
jgi:hypothetical protein